MRSFFRLNSILFFMLFASTALTETLEEIVAQNLEVRGGLESLQAVKSTRVEGIMTMGPGMEAPFTWQWKAPAKMRVDFTVQGMTGTQAFNGDTGWRIMPFMGQKDPEKMSDDELAMVEDQTDFAGPFVDTKEKGYTLEYLGTDEVDGTAVHKIKAAKESGTSTIIYLDAEYFLEIRSESTRTIQGQEMTITTDIGDYKEVGDIVLAHSLQVSTSGMPMIQTMTFNKIELNSEIPDSTFDMPGRPKESEAVEAAPAEPRN